MPKQFGQQDNNMHQNNKKSKSNQEAPAMSSTKSTGKPEEKGEDRQP